MGRLERYQRHIDPVPVPGGAGVATERRLARRDQHGVLITDALQRHERGVHALSRGSGLGGGRSDGSRGRLEPAQEDGVAGDGQAAIAGLGRGEVGGEQAEDEPRGPLQDQVGRWRVAEPGADLAA